MSGDWNEKIYDDNTHSKLEYMRWSYLILRLFDQETSCEAMNKLVGKNNPEVKFTEEEYQRFLRHG